MSEFFWEPPPKPETTYTQCTLIRPVTDPDHRCPYSEVAAQTTSWIPTKFAVVGKAVKLRENSKAEWVDGWVITEVGETREYPPDYRGADLIPSKQPVPPTGIKRKKKK